jgi:hypothetical protein
MFSLAFTFCYILGTTAPTKCCLGPQNDPKILGPQNHRKISKMWNHSELVEQVGGH